MVRQSLDLKFGQHLTLTPALQQSIRLLQLSTTDLQAEVERALDENPMLEAPSDSDTDPESEPSQREIPSIDISSPLTHRSSASSGAGEDEQDLRPESQAIISLREHLLSQLGTTRASSRTIALVGLLIDDLNEDGFLQTPLDSILAMLDPSLDVDEQELLAALRLLQSFDPTGIAARDLSECLSLQLNTPDLEVLPALADPDVLDIAKTICKNFLPVLATGNLGKLQDQMQCDAQKLHIAHSSILRLNPRPASPWSKPAADYAVADVIVTKTAQGWRAILNDSAMPRLNINTLYAQALGSPRSGENAALHGQLQQARWLIRNIQQRYETILRVSEAIITHQQAFFDHGWGSLRPLTLREIAAELGLHESTISRATTQKFMHTPIGTIELKRFFVTGLTSSTGETTSATAIQTRIRDLIQSEETDKPLSDGDLMTLLAKEGISVARRTVAKYRELMRIPTGSLRKSQAKVRQR
jgi:RNA polymerase sigma-54 factor